jgi:hypothetical protein
VFVIFSDITILKNMYDRDEFLRARIDNYLGERHARIKNVKTGFGVIAVREAIQGAITVGSFANSKRDYKTQERSYYIESAPDEPGVARQLWLPASKWVNGGVATLRQREVVATESHPATRFEAWKSIQPLLTDLDDYSEYKGEGQALFEQAKISLQYIDANNENFQVIMSSSKF